MDAQDEQFNKLLDFIMQSFEQGYSEEEIRTTLEDRDLNHEYIDELFAYAQLSDSDTVTVTPVTQQTNSPPRQIISPGIPPAQQETFVQSPTTSPSRPGMFSGRIGRISYLLGVLYVNLIMSFPALSLILAIFLVHGFQLKNFGPIALFAILVLYLVLSLFTTVVHVSLMIRRLHDIGKSGKLVLIALLPVLASFLSAYLILTRQYQELQLASLISLIGTAFAIYLQFMPGTNGPNEYGSPLRSRNFWVILGLKQPKQ